MKFSAQEEFGLRCMVQLARGPADRPITIEEIASRERLTPAHTAKILRLLRRGGLVLATRGQRGGYSLARPAQDILLSDILAVVGQRPYNPEFCERFTGEAAECVHTDSCALRPLWTSIDSMVHAFLSNCRLSDLAAGENPMRAVAESKLATLPELVAWPSSG